MIAKEETKNMLKKIRTSSDEGSFARAMLEATRKMKFQNFVAFLICPGAMAGYSVRIVTSFRGDWIKQYEQKQYQKVDPIFLAASCSDGCYVFSNYRRAHARAEDFWEDAVRFGVGKNGICFSNTVAGSSRIGVSFMTSLGDEASKKILLRSRRILQLTAKIAITRFHELFSIGNLNGCPLNIFELRFFQVLITSNDPSLAFQIDPPFGSNKTMQASIRLKLGVETIFQAVAIVIAKNWLDNLPLYTGEVKEVFPGFPADTWDSFLVG